MTAPIENLGPFIFVSDDGTYSVVIRVDLELLKPLIDRAMKNKKGQATVANRGLFIRATKQPARKPQKDHT